MAPRAALLFPLLVLGLEAFFFAPVVRHSSPITCTSRSSGEEAADGSSFADCVGAELAAALREELSVIAPNEIQVKSLPLAMRGRDVMVVAQTGSGKTLSFLLPILHLLAATQQQQEEEEERHQQRKQQQPQALVIAPTAELAAQHQAVAERLWRALPSNNHKEAPLSPLETALVCTTPEAVLARIARGAAATGEGEGEPRQLSLERLQVVAVDEVDAVLCGGEFNETIPEAAAELLALLLPDELLGQQQWDGEEDEEGERRRRPQFLKATAHLSRQHESALARIFPASQTVRQMNAGGGGAAVLVPTLRQAFHYFTGDDACKTAKLLAVMRQASVDDASLRGEGDGTTLIFCGNEESAASVHALLSAAVNDTNGRDTKDTEVADENEAVDDILAVLNPTVLHGGMSGAARASSLAAFRAGASRCLVTTDVAARGLDVPSVRHVILFDMPTSTQDYVHRAGRTARAGGVGLVTCLVRGGFGGGGAGRYKHLHALQDAPKLEFAALPKPKPTYAATPTPPLSLSLETMKPDSCGGGDGGSGAVAASNGAMAGAALQHTSTVALVPPEEAWPPLQATREALRDKGLYRWPPHINLLYPFLPPQHFEEAAQALALALVDAAATIRKNDAAEAASSETATSAPSPIGSSPLPSSSSVSAITITLDELAIFGGRSRGVLYCCPSDPKDAATLRTIQASLQSALPFCHHQQRKNSGGDSKSFTLSNSGGDEGRGENGGSASANTDANANGGVFTPHLTLAHFASREEAEEARATLLDSRRWEPITFDVTDAICLMHRNGGRGQFAKAAELPLGDVPRIFGQLQEPQSSNSGSSSNYFKGAHANGEGGDEKSGEATSTTTTTTTTKKEWAWVGAKRFESMPLAEEPWIREARKDQHRRRARGKRGGRRRRPRRTPKERAAIAARTPEEIEEIRAQRRLKRERLEAAAGAPGSELSGDQTETSTTHGNPFSGREGFPEIGVCMCEHQDNSVGDGGG